MSITLRVLSQVTASITASAPAIASAQLSAMRGVMLPCAAPLATNGRPSRSSAVRRPEGDHRIGSWPRCAASTALEKPTLPAPRIANRMVVFPAGGLWLAAPTPIVPFGRRCERMSRCRCWRSTSSSRRSMSTRT
jgi:hypothetical protein